MIRLRYKDWNRERERTKGKNGGRDQNAEKECCWGWFTWSELITVIYWTNKFPLDRWISRVSLAHFDAAAPLKMRKCGEDGRNRIMRCIQRWSIHFFHLNCVSFHFLSLCSFPSPFLFYPRSLFCLPGCHPLQLNDIRSVLDSEKGVVVEKRPAINASGSGV